MWGLALVLVTLIVVSAEFVGVRVLQTRAAEQTAVDNHTLDELLPLARSIAISEIQAAMQGGSAFSTPSSSTLRLCPPSQSVCSSVAAFSYTLAGTTAVGGSGAQSQTDQNLLGEVDEQRVILNAHVEIQDSSAPCSASYEAAHACAYPSRDVQIALRIVPAWPYALPDTSYTPSQIANDASSASAADYGGCDGATGCAAPSSSDSSTPTPTILQPNNTCVNDTYDACSLTTPPPANYHSSTFTNADLP